MTGFLSPTLAVLLEKAAMDNGFDRSLGFEDTWLHFGSSQTGLEIWLSSIGNVPLAAFSLAHLERELPDAGVPLASPLPPKAAFGRSVSDMPSLHRLLRRAFSLARSLPDALLDDFQKSTRHLPQTTEAERLVVQRIGQDLFRQALMDFWEGKCAVTGISSPQLLRASHIRPWAQCESDAQRLDVFNGLLLGAHLDAAFDAGLITFSDEGLLIASKRLCTADQSLLGWDRPLRLRRTSPAHQPYLRWHREHIFLLDA